MYKQHLLTGGEVSQFYHMIADQVSIQSVNIDESYLTVYFTLYMEDSEILHEIEDLDLEEEVIKVS